MGFKLEDITEEFLSKVVFYEFGHPSGLGDTAGSIWMLTEDGQVYFIAGEGFEYEYSDWGKVFPVFDEFVAWDAPGKVGHDESAEPTGVDHDAWKTCRVFLGDCVIRREKFDEWKAEYDRRSKEGGYVSAVSVAAEAFGFDSEECRRNRIDYDKTLEWVAAERRERAIHDAYKARVRLSYRDVKWVEIQAGESYAYKGQLGCWAMLHMREDDGTFCSVLWAIQYQVDTYMKLDETSRPSTYNLYFKRWLDEPAPVKPADWDLSSDTLFIEMGMEFAGSFHTVENAKRAAMQRNGCIGWGNFTKDNLIDPDTLKPVFPPDEYEYDLGERPHAVLCGEAADWWLVRIRDEETGEVVELIWDYETFNSAMAEHAMAADVPTFGSLLSIDPLHGM